MLGVSFRDVNCKLRYFFRVWRFKGQCINEPIPALPEMCVNKWAKKDKEQMKKERRKRKLPSTTPPVPITSYKAIKLVSVWVKMLFLRGGGGDNAFFPFGRSILRRASLPLRVEITPIPQAQYIPVGSTNGVEVFSCISAMSFLQIACIKTLSFLRCKEITSGGFLIELLPVSKTTWTSRMW